MGLTGVFQGRESKVYRVIGTLSGRIRELRLTETQMLLGLAFVVGIGSGFGAVAFRGLISLFTWVFFTEIFGHLGRFGRLGLIAIPPLGAFLYAPLIRYFAPEARGHGVPEVMLAVALSGGRMRPAVVVVKALGSALCIGSGGSVGREGPIVQVGSAIGSTIGQVLGLSDARIKALVAAGAAGAIAATFNAPIAGAFFALEVILAEFNARNFSIVVIAAVTADVIGRAFFGANASFAVPPYAGPGAVELPLYLLLGCCAGPVGAIFIKVLYFTEDAFEAWNVPWLVKPIAGGALLGALGVVVPAAHNSLPSAILGVGYPTMNAALYNNLALNVLLVLLVAKLIAVSLTIGSGGSGGVFAPSLFLGAMLGGTFGRIGHVLIPGIVGSNVSGYAIAGMAAVFAGSAQAPITAILILFELTSDYTVILPLMLTVVSATAVGRALSSHTMYTLKLARRGIDITAGRDVNLMRTLTVGDAMERGGQTVAGRTSIAEFVALMNTAHRLSFPVVDDAGRFLGMVSAEDVEEAHLNGDCAQTVKDIARHGPCLHPDQTLEDVLERFALVDQQRIPVISSDKQQRLLGTLDARGVLATYRASMLKRGVSGSIASPARQ